MAVTDFELGQARQFAQSNSITGNLSFLEGAQFGGMMFTMVVTSWFGSLQNFW